MTVPASLPAIIEGHAAGPGVFLEEVDGDRQTYAEAHLRTRRLAAALRRFGIGDGDRVLLFMPLSIDMVNLWLGLGVARGVAVPINLAFRGAALAYIVEDSEAETLLCTAEFLPRIIDLGAQVGRLRRVVVVDEPGRPREQAGPLRIDGFDVLAEDAEDPSLTLPANHDPSITMYTSGTTGDAKGVVLPWGAISGSGENIRAAGGWERDDALYMPFPPNHISSSQWLAGIAIAGGRVIIRREGFRTDAFWSDIERHGCTVALLISAMAAFVMSEPMTAAARDNGLRRVCIIPGRADMDEFERRFGVSTYTLYGSTEMGAVISSADRHVPPAGCGALHDGFEARIVDGDDRPVPDGTAGELVLRPIEPWTTFAEYLHKPQETLGALRNMWFHTGDAFRRDADGTYVFVDRIKDIIRRRGENISSMQVEAYVVALEEVLECAAVPVPATDGEDEVKVCVALRDGCQLAPERLIERLRAAEMPRFMLPLYVEVIDALPKTPTNKVRKSELRREGITASTWKRPPSRHTEPPAEIVGT